MVSFEELFDIGGVKEAPKAGPSVPPHIIAQVSEAAKAAEIIFKVLKELGHDYILIDATGDAPQVDTVIDYQSLKFLLARKAIVAGLNESLANILKVAKGKQKPKGDVDKP